MPIQKDTSSIPLTPPTGNQGPLGYTFSEGALSERLSLLISNIIGTLTIIAGGALIFYLILGTVAWTTAGGDTQKTQSAKNKIINAIIGIVITAIAYPIIFILGKLLGIPFLEPSALINKLFT